MEGDAEKMKDGCHILKCAVCGDYIPEGEEAWGYKGKTYCYDTGCLEGVLEKEGIIERVVSE